jgi:opacity protein-like surface antigen
MIHKPLFITAASLLCAFAASAQDVYRQEVSAQVVGSFVKSTTDGGVQETATHTANVLGTYRYFLNRHSGVELNYGWSRGTQEYRWVTGAMGIPSDVHEVSVAYVYRIPFRQWTFFALGGAGAMIFDPRESVRTADMEARASFNYGAGADFNITRRIFLRAEYRGLVYSTPTYGVAAINGLDRLTHRAEPSIGFGYRF